MMNEDDVLENTPETFEKLTNEVNEYKDKYYRALSDSQNFKNRLQREKEDAVRFSNERFSKDLLETLDNFENSLKVDMPDDVRVGVGLLYKGLLNTLKKHGVEEINTEKFDPNFHEAIAKVDNGLDDNSIVEVLRKGYILNGRLLRAAMVIIQGK
jgi:molecular chaperone GrpE